MPDSDAIAVLKFGGSSFIELSDYNQVAGYLAGRVAAEGIRAVVVVSGMSGTTGRLLESARSIDPQLQPEVQDQILATAEMISASFLRAALAAAGCPAIDLWASQIGIRTDRTATRARIVDIDPAPVRRAIGRYRIVVVAGGQAAHEGGRITMLGRNSSDLTAIVLAAALGLDSCEIFSDVPGVFSADPHVVTAAAPIARVSYEQCAAMATSGAKVLHTGSVCAAQEAGIAILCRRLELNPGPPAAATGTIVSDTAGTTMAVVGNRRGRLLRMHDADKTNAALTAARRASFAAVAVPDDRSVAVAAPGDAIDLQDVLREAGIATSVITGLGLVSVVAPSGRADRRLVPLADIDDVVRELHARLHRAQAPNGPPPAIRRSPHSGLLAGGPR